MELRYCEKCGDVIPLTGGGKASPTDQFLCKRCSGQSSGQGGGQDRAESGSSEKAFQGIIHKSSMNLFSTGTVALKRKEQQERQALEEEVMKTVGEEVSLEPGIDRDAGHDPDALADIEAEAEIEETDSKAGEGSADSEELRFNFEAGGGSALPARTARKLQFRCLHCRAILMVRPVRMLSRMVCPKCKANLFIDRTGIVTKRPPGAAPPAPREERQGPGKPLPEESLSPPEHRLLHSRTAEKAIESSGPPPAAKRPQPPRVEAPPTPPRQLAAETAVVGLRPPPPAARKVELRPDAPPPAVRSSGTPPPSRAEGPPAAARRQAAPPPVRPQAARPAPAAAKGARVRPGAEKRPVDLETWDDFIGGAKTAGAPGRAEAETRPSRQERKAGERTASSPDLGIEPQDLVDEMSEPEEFTDFQERPAAANRTPLPGRTTMVQIEWAGAVSLLLRTFLVMAVISAPLFLAHSFLHSHAGGRSVEDVGRVVERGVGKVTEKLAGTLAPTAPAKGR